MDELLRISLKAVQDADNGEDGGTVRGVRGGSPRKSMYYPERRESSLNTPMTSSGQRALHRFGKDHEVAIPGLKNEQPWHRMAAFMLLAGRTNSEIAMAGNVTTQEVTVLRSQRWFQELLATLANEHGQDIVGLLASEAAASIATLVEIRDDVTASARNRISAAQILFEQAHGKPTQKVISAISHTVAKSPKEEMEEIQQELEALNNRNR